MKTRRQSEKLVATLLQQMINRRSDATRRIDQDIVLEEIHVQDRASHLNHHRLDTVEQPSS